MARDRHSKKHKVSDVEVVCSSVVTSAGMSYSCEGTWQRKCSRPPSSELVPVLGREFPVATYMESSPFYGLSIGFAISPSPVHHVSTWTSL